MSEDDIFPIRSTANDPVDDSNEQVSKQLELKQLEITSDEETLIARMYNLVGERWSLIAGRIPGRSAEEIEKFWNARRATSTTEKELENPILVTDNISTTAGNKIIEKE